MVPRTRSTTGGTSAPWDWATGSIKRQGAWAVMLALVLGFFGFQINRIIPVITDYVTTSGQNNQQLVKIANAQVLSDSQNRVILDKLAESVLLLSSSVTATDRRVEANGILLKQLSDDMDELTAMMKNVPEEHQQIIALLQQIKQGVDKLVKDATETPP